MKKVTLIVFVSVLITACGGGGANEPTDSNDPSDAGGSSNTTETDISIDDGDTSPGDSNSLQNFENDAPEIVASEIFLDDSVLLPEKIRTYGGYWECAVGTTYGDELYRYELYLNADRTGFIRAISDAELLNTQISWQWGVLDGTSTESINFVPMSDSWFRENPNYSFYEITFQRSDNTVHLTALVDTESPSFENGENYRNWQCDLRNVSFSDADTIPNEGGAEGYEIGDIGPGGGVVFYISRSAENGNKGLEAAPTDASIGGNQLFEWGCQLQKIPGIQSNSDIGWGRSNTESILSNCDEANTAAFAAASYTGGGYNDWYLPSAGEQIEWLSVFETCLETPDTVRPECPGEKLDDFEGWYWTSTDRLKQNGSIVAWKVRYWFDIWDINKRELHTSVSNNDLKSGLGRVRPVRAFGWDYDPLLP